MDNAKLYYTAPSDECFEDLRKAALEIWQCYGYDYAEEKIKKIKSLENIKDNFMFMFAMFDINNQRSTLIRIKPETRKAIKDRIISGGMSEKQYTTYYSSDSFYEIVDKLKTNKSNEQK